MKAISMVIYIENNTDLVKIFFMVEVFKIKKYVYNMFMIVVKFYH
jgi:hypothetical protein